jgi:hypothetical protein
MLQYLIQGISVTIGICGGLRTNPPQLSRDSYMKGKMNKLRNKTVELIAKSMISLFENISKIQTPVDLISIQYFVKITLKSNLLLWLFISWLWFCFITHFLNFLL